MAGIKVHDAQERIKKVSAKEVESLVKEYNDSRKPHFVNKEDLTMETLPFQPALVGQAEKNGYRIGRIIGQPIPAFRENPIDAKYVLKQEIVNQSGKYKPTVYFKVAFDQNGCMLPKADPDWFFERWLKKRLFKYDYDKNAQGPDQIKHWYKEHPVFKLLYENIAYENEKGKKRNSAGNPSLYIMFNFIDRMDNWCVENKRTKIPVNNFYVQQSDGDNPEKVNLSPGLPMYGIEGAFNILAEQGTLATKDVVLAKNGTSYIFNTYTNDLTPANIKALGKEGPLTADEKNYEATNLDEVFNESPHSFIKQQFGKLIEQFSNDLDVKEDYQELCELVAQETGTPVEPTKTTSIPSSKVGENAPATMDSFVADKPVVAEKPAERIFNDDIGFDKPVETKPVIADNKSFDFSKWKHFSSLPADQQAVLKKIIVGTDAHGNPVFDSGYPINNLMYCFSDSCKYVENGNRSAWPPEVTKCPVCGDDFTQA